VVERTFAWLNQFRRLRVRYDKRADSPGGVPFARVRADLLAVAAQDMEDCVSGCLPLRRPSRGGRLGNRVRAAVLGGFRWPGPGVVYTPALLTDGKTAFASSTRATCVNGRIVLRLVC
jgi:hypothetical protein